MDKMENFSTEQEKSNAERLMGLMTQAEPAIVNGSDFMACNFGDESQNYSEAGRDSIISGASGSAIYNRETKKWRLAAPYIRIVNASHLPSHETVSIEFKFEEFRKLIEQI